MDQSDSDFENKGGKKKNRGFVLKGQFRDTSIRGGREWEEVIQRMQPKNQDSIGRKKGRKRVEGTGFETSVT